MSLDDIFGPRSGRHQHPDMTILSEIILQIDGKTEDSDFDMGKFLAELADPESVAYVSFQRAMRMASQAGVQQPRLVAALATVWIDGFITGHALHERRAL